MEQYEQKAWELRQKLITESVIKTGDYNNKAINAEVRRQLGEYSPVVKENLTAYWSEIDNDWQKHHKSVAEAVRKVVNV